MSYLIKKIESAETIGNSLSTVNENYTILSNWIIDVQSLYNSTFLPLYNFYIKYSDRMNSVLTTIETLSGDWQSFQTTVETNSAKWLQPFSIWYPNLIPSPFNDSALSNVKNWLTTNFPIVNSDNSVNYVEGQQFIVNCHTYRVQEKINAFYKLIDYSLCRTTNATIYAYCSDDWANNYVACSNGNKRCGYQRTCSNSAASDCFYLTPYYKNYTDSAPIGNVNTHLTQAYGKIEASVTAKYADRFENTAIKSISFRVVDCQWNFDKFIT
jgi:hypothetical protein